jgi:hypothetical protein
MSRSERLEFDEFVHHVIGATRMKVTEPVNPYLDLYDNLGLDLMGVARLMRECERLAGVAVRSRRGPNPCCMADAYAHYAELCTAADGSSS